MSIVLAGEKVWESVVSCALRHGAKVGPVGAHPLGALLERWLAQFWISGYQRLVYMINGKGRGAPVWAIVAVTPLSVSAEIRRGVHDLTYTGRVQLS